VRELGQYGIILETLFGTDSRRSYFVSTTSKVRVNATEALKKSGIAIPDMNMRIITSGEKIA
jgi:small conductance mechanosensitive channel